MEVPDHRSGGCVQNRLETVKIEREGQVQGAAAVASAETAGPELRPW